MSTQMRRPMPRNLPRPISCNYFSSSPHNCATILTLSRIQDAAQFGPNLRRPIVPAVTSLFRFVGRSFLSVHAVRKSGMNSAFGLSASGVILAGVILCFVGSWRVIVSGLRSWFTLRCVSVCVFVGGVKVRSHHVETSSAIARRNLSTLKAFRYE